MLLLQSPVRSVLEEMMHYTGKKEDHVDMEQAYERFMMDPRAAKRFDKRAFRQVNIFGNIAGNIIVFSWLTI